jgi:hypothetical protein
MIINVKTAKMLTVTLMRRPLLGSRRDRTTYELRIPDAAFWRMLLK